MDVQDFINKPKPELLHKVIVTIIQNSGTKNKDTYNKILHATAAVLAATIIEYDKSGLDDTKNLTLQYTDITHTIDRLLSEYEEYNKLNDFLQELYDKMFWVNTKNITRKNVSMVYSFIMQMGY